MKNVHFENADEAIATLRMATDAACVGIWDRNLQTGLISGSEQYWKILDLPPGSRLDFEGLVQLIHPEDRDRVTSAIKRACDPHERSEYQVDYRIVRRNGEVRWVSVRGKCFFEEQIDGSQKPVRFLGTFLDSTEHKLAQQALLQAEQLAATGRLAASIAHEINNPLESITNLLYLLRSEEDREQRTTYLSLAETELARVAEISTNTLRFYRDPVGVTDVHLPGLVRSVVSLFHGRIALKRIDVAFDLEAQATVKTVQGELRQVLVNLVGNALDAMPTGGRLRVRCRRFTKRIGMRPSGIGICVADTGAGMSPEVLKRICEPFYTTRGSSGTGLGLWLSSEIL